MPAIHFIETKNEIRQVPDTRDEWFSGNWHVSVQVAEKLIGGDFYVHWKQAAPSHHGGTILGFHLVEVTGVSRVVFRYRFTPRHRGVYRRSGWGRVMALDLVDSTASDGSKVLTTGT